MGKKCQRSKVNGGAVEKALLGIRGSFRAEIPPTYKQEESAAGVRQMKGRVWDTRSNNKQV